MFTIGQFAQLAQVSVRALRHYDELGLLEPAAVDDVTGYRRYEASQLRDLNRVLVLKELGFTLHEIGEMERVGLDGDELLAMLRLRQAEAEREAEQERARLERVAVRIQLLSAHSTPEDGMAAVVVKPLPACRLAAIVDTIESYDGVDFGVRLPQMFGQLVDETLRVEIRPPIGPIQAHFQHRDDDRIDVIAGVPVHADEEIDSDVVVTLDVPHVDEAATVVRHGRFTEAGPAVALLSEWLEANQQASSFDHYREVYLQPEGPPDTWVAEHQFVLKPTFTT